LQLADKAVRAPISITMTKALIFDLDNCLAAANEVGEALFEPVFEAIREANQGTLSEEALNQAFADCWRRPLDWVAGQHGFSAAMRAAGLKMFAAIEVTRPMRGYDDLAILAELPGQRFLVTSGFRRLQASKIRALGIEHLFAAIYIDAIDDGERRGKQDLFADILRTYQLGLEEVLVVGDDPESEIAAGNRLGLKTVQILRPGVQRSDRATFHIHNLAELRTG
jgi:FMN phosphatase YigB (HAD superfamily)